MFFGFTFSASPQSFIFWIIYAIFNLLQNLQKKSAMLRIQQIILYTIITKKIDLYFLLQCLQKLLILG